MIIIEKFERVQIEEMNRTVYWAYEFSKKAGNERIDLGELIWENDVEEIVSFLREAGVTEFTISQTYSGLLNLLAEFEKHGCKVQGLTNVYSRYEDLFTGKHKLIPAIRMVL